MIKEISVHGSLTFARFMERTLYDTNHGYYMTQAVTQDQSPGKRIGWEGDFYTAPELSPMFAKTIVQQVLEIDAQLGHPSIFRFVEMGCGNGTFAADFLQYCRRFAPDFLIRLRYILVEQSVHLQAVQQSCIHEVMGSLEIGSPTWVCALDQLDEDSVIGVMFSNELVDAFPVHRICSQNHKLLEILVDYVEGEFVERLGPLSATTLEEYVYRHGIVLQEGQTSELHLAAEQWMKQVARVFQKGVMITIDYGHTGSDYYAPERKDGTLMCYHKHTASTNPYANVGEQDMTAHVNFSVLAKAGNDCGLLTVGFTTLANWLMGLDVEGMVEGHDSEAPEIQALCQLLRPHGMGTTFKVFVQQRGMDAVLLQGLRYRAFFGDIL